LTSTRRPEAVGTDEYVDLEYVLNKASEVVVFTVRAAMPKIQRSVLFLPTLFRFLIEPNREVFPQSTVDSLSLSNF